MFVNMKYTSFVLCLFSGIVIGLFFFDYNTSSQPFELATNDSLPYQNGSCIVKIESGSAKIEAGTTDPNFWVELNGEEISRDTEYRIGSSDYYSVNNVLTHDETIGIHHECNLRISSETGATGNIYLDWKMKMPWLGWTTLVIILSWWGLIYIWDLYYYGGIHFEKDF